MFSIIIYNEGTSIGGYKSSSSSYPVPSVGDTVIFENERYRVRKVIFDYSRFDVNQGNELIVHIYCGSVGDN